MAEKVKEYELTEKEQNAKMDSLANEYMKRKLPNATWEDVENLSFVFTYKTTVNLVKLSENLVKHSKKLTCWTYALSFFASVQIAVIILVALKIIE